MLIGSYPAKLSHKGRTAIPKKFRDELGNQVIITQGYEHCLTLVSTEAWSKLTNFDKPFILDAARDTDRFLLGNAFENEPDDQGRIIIPAALKSYANLSDDIIFIGVGNRVEVWNANKWQEYQEYLAQHSNEIAKRLIESPN